MIAFVPRPQEVHFTPESFHADAKTRAFLSPSDSEDATEECLRPVLRKLLAPAGRAVSECRLPGRAGASFAIASSPSDAKKLVSRALANLKTELKTYVFRPDGVYMNEPRNGMGLRKPSAEEIAADEEAYFLHIGADGVAIAANARAGLFYGVQTLRQIVDACPPRELPGVRIRDWPTQKMRGIHIDMKYLFHKPKYLESYVKRMASLKLNAALMEYEDKFPFGRYPFLRHEACMTPAQLRSLLETCRRYHVDAIPLVQTLGHLEFALKHDELATIREMPEVHTQACPTNPETLSFVLDLLDEVAEYHPDTPYFFIGGDETTFLGECPRCAKVAEKQGPVSLYLDHIVKVAKHVIAKGKRPILWDDIVRKDAAKAKRLPKETVLAHWIYETVRERHGERKIPPALEKFYRTKGKRPAMWPDTLSTYPHHDYYRQLGFDVIAVPCFYFGTLVPAYPVAVWNTNTWAEKNVVCDAIGMINSQWASFRVPQETGWYGLAVTADATWDWPDADMFDLETRFTRAWFGLDGADIVPVMIQVSEGVGFPSGFGRPLHLLHYAYMDCVIHFHGNMRERQRKGASVANMDYLFILKQKYEALEKDGLAGEARQRLNRVEALISDALPKLRAARKKARREKPCLDLYVVSAEFKLWRIELVRLLLDAFEHRNGKGGPPRASLKQAVHKEKAMRKHVREAYAKIIHPKELDGYMSALFDGEEEILQEYIAGKYVPPKVNRALAKENAKGEDIF